MQLELLKSKIHMATVTDGDVIYEGSMSIDEDLMDKVGMRPYEKVLCGNMANGNRFETYAIPGERGSRCIVLNGATAHLGKKGDRLTIMSYAFVDSEEEQKGWTPKVVVLNEDNSIKATRGI